MIKHLLLYTFIFCFNTLVLAQNSPYFYSDTTYQKDDGVNSEEHRLNMGKIVFYPHPNNRKINYNEQDKKYGKREISAISAINAKMYFKYSPRHYHDKYIKQTNLNKEDWYYMDRVKFSNSKDHLIESPTFYLVCKLEINGKEYSSWIEPIENGYYPNTVFEIKLWEASCQYSDDYSYDDDEFASMEGDNDVFPLYYFLTTNPAAGNYKISLKVYLAKNECKTISDVGPDILAEGSFTVVVDGKLAKQLKTYGKVKKKYFSLKKQ